MLIQESDLAVSRGGDVFSLLESMDCLTEDESVYNAAMVPVVENSRIGAYVVALEDIMEFCESNGIEDMGYAVSQICEASNVEPSTLAFSVQETSVLADDDMAQLAADVMSEGCNVLAVPPSPYDPLNEMAGMAVEACLDGNDSLLEAYANFDFEAFLDEGTVMDPKKYAQMKHISIDKAKKELAGLANDMAGGREKSERNRATATRKEGRFNADVNKYSDLLGIDKSNFYKADGSVDTAYLNSMKSKYLKGHAAQLKKEQNLNDAKGAGKYAKLAGKPAAPATPAVTPEKIDSIAKEAEKKGPNFIARAIANLNNWATKMKAQRTAPGVDHGVIDKVLAKIASAIAYLTKKLGAEKYQAQMKAANA